MAKKESYEEREARRGGESEVAGSDSAYRIQRAMQKKGQRQESRDKRKGKR